MSVQHEPEAAQLCDELQTLIPDYAFGLATPDEVRYVEANLIRCPEAAAQLAEYQQLQDELRENVPQIDPSPALMDKLMARVTAVENERSSVPPAPIPLPEQKSPPRTPIGWWIAAAALIALVITNGYWFMRIEDLARRQTALEMDNAVLLSTDQNLRWARLPPPEGDDRSAFVMWNDDKTQGLVYARNFPALEPDQVYQFWLTRGDLRVSGGTFQVDENGNGALVFDSPDSINNYTWARITTEPVTGSEQPSDTILVNGRLFPQEESAPS